MEGDDCVPVYYRFLAHQFLLKTGNRSDFSAWEETASLDKEGAYASTRLVTSFEIAQDWSKYILFKAGRDLLYVRRWSKMKELEWNDIHSSNILLHW